MRLFLKTTLKGLVLRLLPCLEQVLQAAEVRLAADTEAELVEPVELRIEAELAARTAAQQAVPERQVVPVVRLAAHTAAAVVSAPEAAELQSVLPSAAQLVLLPEPAVKPLPPEGSTDPESSLKPASSQEVSASGSQIRILLTPLWKG